MTTRGLLSVLQGMKTLLIALCCAAACGGKDAAPAKDVTTSPATRPTPSERITVIVTLAGNRPKPDVQHDLAQAGFILQQDLDATGTLVGTASPDALAALRAVAGVTAVERDQPVTAN